MQDRVVFRTPRATRARIVWRGSFAEDGWYFLGPSWSLGGGDSTDAWNEQGEVEEEEDGGGREKRTGI